MLRAELRRLGRRHVESRDGYGWTALHWAANDGRLACLEALLAAGASVHSVSIIGFTPLLYASINGHVACVRALIAAGSDVNRASHSGSTPFSKALNSGRRRVLKILLRAGADVNTDGFDRNDGPDIPTRVARLDAWALVDEIRAAGGWQNYVTRRREFIVRAFVIATRGKFCKYINAEIASFMEPPGGESDSDSQDANSDADSDSDSD